MKIQFDIKYRPQIESGEYKVILDCGVEAEILAWDKPGEYPIVCMAKKEGAIPFRTDNNGIAYHYPEGLNYSDLFILTPEPELTEFEATLLSYLSDDTSGELDKETMHKCVKARATELLELAKKELCKDCSEKQRNTYIYGDPIPHTWFPPCYHGGPCTNPMHDCINCPRQSTMGINTTTGTSAAKMESHE
jgi:hypothetical protein